MSGAAMLSPAGGLILSPSGACRVVGPDGNCCCDEEEPAASCTDCSLCATTYSVSLSGLNWTADHNTQDCLREFLVSLSGTMTKHPTIACRWDGTVTGSCSITYTGEDCPDDPTSCTLTGNVTLTCRTSGFPFNTPLAWTLCFTWSSNHSPCNSNTCTRSWLMGGTALCYERTHNNQCPGGGTYSSVSTPGISGFTVNVISWGTVTVS